MKIIFDPGVGINVGFGHLKRCEAIADELVHLCHEVDFIIRDRRFDYYINSEKYGIVRRINNNSKYDMIVLDRYDIAESSLYTYKRMCEILVRLDDASPRIARDKISDILINGNPYATKEMYEQNVKKDCIIIAGPDYIPMSRRFCTVRKKYKVKKEIKKILVTFGGSLLGSQYAQQISNWILNSKIELSLVILNVESWSIGNSNNIKVKFVPFTNELEQVLVDIDVAITSSGSTCWQLAAVGIPFVAYKIAPNQSTPLQYILQNRLGIGLKSISTNERALVQALTQLNYPTRKFLWSHARNLIDCQGSRRIAKLLHKIC